MKICLERPGIDINNNKQLSFCQIKRQESKRGSPAAPMGGVARGIREATCPPWRGHRGGRFGTLS